MRVERVKVVKRVTMIVTVGETSKGHHDESYREILVEGR
jgi:hypothetical protein